MRLKFWMPLKVILVFLLVGCVSIVINFPAAEVKEAAKRIEKDIRSEPPVDSDKPAPVPQSQRMPTEPSFTFGIMVADAANIDLNVDSPGIRAAKASRKARYPQLKPYLDKGILGESRDGLLALRTVEGLDARVRVMLNTLIDGENKDRKDLFSEFARANNLADIGAVQTQFAHAIRDEMASGQWYQDDSGKWIRKP